MSTTGMSKRRTAFGKVLKTTSRHLKQVDQDKAGRKPLPRKDRLSIIWGRKIRQFYL